MKKIISSLIFFIMSSGIVMAEDKAFVSTRTLTAPSATKIAAVAEQACREKGYQVSVAVVDRYGNLLAFVRAPLSGGHTINVAQDKAYTAASFQSDTLTLASRIAFLKGTPRLSLVGGGVPIRIAGKMYGAVGVSGAPGEKQPGDIDHACGMAGIDGIRETLEFAE